MSSEDEDENWVLGASLTLVGSLLINASTVLVKVAHTDRLSEKSRNLVRKGGLFMFSLGNILNFGAYSFAAQSLLSALGSVQFVSNVVLSHWLLGEPVTSRILKGVAAIVLGNVVLVVFGPHSTTDHDEESLMELYVQPLFLIFIALLAIVWVLALFHHSVALAVTRAWDRHYYDLEWEEEARLLAEEEAMAAMLLERKPSFSIHPPSPPLELSSLSPSPESDMSQVESGGEDQVVGVGSGEDSGSSSPSSPSSIPQELPSQQPIVAVRLPAPVMGAQESSREGHHVATTATEAPPPLYETPRGSNLSPADMEHHHNHHHENDTESDVSDDDYELVSAPFSDKALSLMPAWVVRWLLKRGDLPSSFESRLLSPDAVQLCSEPTSPVLSSNSIHNEADSGSVGSTVTGNTLNARGIMLFEEEGEREKAVTFPEISQRPPWSSQWQPFTYSFLTAVPGSFSVVLAKSLSLMLTGVLRTGLSPLLRVFPCVVLVLWLCFMVGWLRALDRGLRSYTAMVIIPALQVAWTLSSVLWGLIYFEENEEMTSVSLPFFVVGVLIVLAGVTLLRPEVTSEEPSSTSTPRELVEGDDAVEMVTAMSLSRHGSNLTPAMARVVASQGVGGAGEGEGVPSPVLVSGGASLPPTGSPKRSSPTPSPMVRTRAGSYSGTSAGDSSTTDSHILLWSRTPDLSASADAAAVGSGRTRSTSTHSGRRRSSSRERRIRSSSAPGEPNEGGVPGDCDLESGGARGGGGSGSSSSSITTSATASFFKAIGARRGSLSALAGLASAIPTTGAAGGSRKSSGGGSGRRHRSRSRASPQLRARGSPQQGGVRGPSPLIGATAAPVMVLPPPLPFGGSAATTTTPGSLWLGQPPVAMAGPPSPLASGARRGSLGLELFTQHPSPGSGVLTGGGPPVVAPSTVLRSGSNPHVSVYPTPSPPSSSSPPQIPGGSGSDGDVLKSPPAGSQSASKEDSGGSMRQRSSSTPRAEAEDLASLVSSEASSSGTHSQQPALVSGDEDSSSSSSSSSSSPAHSPTRSPRGSGDFDVGSGSEGGLLAGRSRRSSSASR